MSVFKSRKERDVFKLLTSSYFTSIDVKKSNGKIDLYENLPATFAPKILVQTVYIFFPFDELGDERVFFHVLVLHDSCRTLVAIGIVD